MITTLKNWIRQLLSAEHEASRSGAYVHPTVIVDGACRIGKGTQVWQFSHLYPDCRIGENCIIGQNVMVGVGVVVGDGCKVQNNVSLYEGVTLEDDVFCGPSCVFTNVINPRAAIERKHEFQKTLVQTGATIGANATIVCGNAIGQYAFVGAGAVVTEDVEDFAVMVGNPSRKIGYICKCGEMLSRKPWTETTCTACGLTYSTAPSGQVSLKDN